MRFALVLALLVDQAAPARPAVPVEPIAAILEAFRTHRVVALADGRSHGDEQLRTLLFAVIRDPTFAAVCTDTGYMRTLRERMAIVGLKPEIDRLKQYCDRMAAK